MKDRPDAILRPRQAEYLDGLLPPRDPLLAEMEEHAEREGIPVSDPEVGRLLSLLARSRNARAVLEIGTAIGYGTLCLARGAPEAEVITIDVDPDRLATAREYLERGEVADRVELLEGEALEILPRLERRFDLVYIDAVKSDYRRYLDLSLPSLEIGGLIVVDNLLWKGRVADPPEEDDPAADAIRQFNVYFSIHPQLASVVLPLGDGVGLAAKTGPTVMEMGGPF